MPFGPYRDHADCVRHNQDKDDPDAYCAALERQIAGDSMSVLEPPDADGVDAWLAMHEADVSAMVVAELRRIVAEALERWEASLTAAGDAAAFDDMPGEWGRFVDGPFGDRIGGLYLAGGLSAWVQSEAHNPIPVGAEDRWARVVNERAVEYQRSASNRLRGVGDRLWRDVRQRTVEGVERGDTNEQIKGRIEAVTGFTEYRADTIARTETVAAYNGGDWDGAMALGEWGPIEKSWLATSDARTRPSHAAADGQTVGFRDPFVVGGVTMMRPHDPGAPAAEVVNCRCVLQLYYAGDTRPDGSEVTGHGQTPGEVRLDEPERPVLRVVPDRGVPANGWDDFDEAFEYLTLRHPNVRWHRADMASWDRRTNRDVALWADDVAERFPAQWADVHYVGSRSEAFDIDWHGTKMEIPAYDWAAGEYAHASSALAAMSDGQGFIGINPMFARDWDRWADSSLLGMERRWTLGDSPIDTLYHEFGHIWHGSTHKITARSRGYSPARYDQGQGFAFAYRSDYPHPDMTYAWVERFVLDDFIPKSKRYEYGSKYGGQDDFEAVAESWSSAMRPGHPQVDGRMAAAGRVLDEAAREFSVDHGHDPYTAVGQARLVLQIEDVFRRAGIQARPKGWRARVADARDVPGVES